MHHTDSGLYYLQSRYYDPKLGRFLNADALVSTGQGVLSNNMFAYCNNNPVVYFDPSGKALDVTMYHIREVGGGSASNDFKKPTQWKCLLGNESETAVLNAEQFAFYKGALVIRHSNDFLTSWSLFGVVFLNTNVKSSETLKHEYGHYLQEKQYGTVKYISAIFIPSATYNGLSRLFPDLNYNYYNMPWEYDADKRGNVNRDHASWSDSFADGYFAIQGMLP